MDFGKKISALRKSKGMTQEDLGKVLNVTYQAVSKWERDESLPDIEMMSRIAKFFEVPIDYFVDGETAVTAVKETADAAPAPAYVGVCTECGKMLTKDEAHSLTPKIVCKSCAERLRKESDAARTKQENMARARKEKEIAEQCGHGADFTLIISLILSVACYIGLTVFCFNSKLGDDAPVYGFVLFLVPLAVFGYTHSIGNFIKDLKDIDFDEDIGYTRNVSLATGVAVGLFNLACFLTLYIATGETVFIGFTVGATILSFTFVSQYMWGGVIQSIFTAGGFTFKIPGFIITLDIDSVIWMIVVKFLLGIIAALVMVITTAIVITVAIIVSAVTFIPSVISKSYKDTKVRNE